LARPWHGIDQPPPSSPKVNEKSTAVPLLPFSAFMACSRVNFIFLLHIHSGEKELRCFALTMKAYRENGYLAALILNLVTRWGKKTSSSLGCFTPGERAPITH
jgi:hypothetical protein